MNRRSLFKRLVALALLIGVSLMSGVKAAWPQSARSRGDVLRELAKAEQILKEHPEDAKKRQNATRLLYESGDFWRAAETIRPLLDAGEASPKALALAAELEYLLGNFDEAERLCETILAHSESSRSAQFEAKVCLVMIYYQTNRFDRAKEIDLPRAIKLPHWDVMKSFDQEPYQLEWSGDPITEIPFIVSDPGTMFTVTFNGIPVHVLLDTGADMCVIDTELANEMEIKPITSASGAGAGGKGVNIGFAKIDSLTIGSVTVKNLPIMILPTQQFSKGFADGKYPMGGLIGTALLRQFLTTIDYANDKMVLRDRNPKTGRTLRKQMQDHIVSEVPFVLSATHLMMARGSLNDRSGLTFFVDSGMSGAQLCAPPQTLQYLGIPEPETEVDPETLGGVGGTFPTGLFPIESLSLGQLYQKDVEGEYGSRPASSYWEMGFVQDGLITHDFLRRYASWTIDFDRREYIFTNTP